MEKGVKGPLQGSDRGWIQEGVLSVAVLATSLLCVQARRTPASGKIPDFEDQEALEPRDSFLRTLVRAGQMTYYEASLRVCYALGVQDLPVCGIESKVW